MEKHQSTAECIKKIQFGMISVLILLCITLNCHGLHNDSKWPKLWCFLKSSWADVVALQETHLTDGQLRKFSLFMQDFDIFVSNGTSNSAGVLTAVC